LLLTPIRPRPTSIRLPTANVLSGLFEGIRFVWRTQAMLAAITLDLFAVLLGGATALLPIFAADIIDRGPLDPGLALGILRAAPAVGALVMAVALAHLPPLRRPGVAMLLSVAGFGLATVVFGLSTNFALSFALLALTGALDNVSVVVRHTLMQVLTPDEMRGRVAAVNTVFISSSNELGEFESGATAAWWGPVRSVVVGGAGTILVVLLVLARWPGLLRLPPLHELAVEKREPLPAPVAAASEPIMTADGVTENAPQG
jgi:MFS family permease